MRELKLRACNALKGKVFKSLRGAVNAEVTIQLPGTWQKLVKRMEQSKYTRSFHQWLEQHIGPLDIMGGEEQFTLDLHLPIRE
jgi:hypothetical protein